MEDFEAAVRNAEKRRCAAMLADDVIALDAVLDERLRFSHATGAIDDKPAYLSKIRAGRIDYDSIEWSETAVTPLAPTAALLTGRMLTRVHVDGIEKTLDNRVLAAWTRTEERWRLIAFQSTPIRA